MSCDEFIANKTGRGLIAFSDPAGAKACLAFAWMLREQKPEVEFLIVSNKSYGFYSDWDLSVEVTDDPALLQLEDVRWVFTGTSHPDSSKKFEVKLIKRCIEFGCNVPEAGIIRCGDLEIDLAYGDLIKTHTDELISQYKPKECRIDISSFVDHSTNILARFQLDDLLIFPKTIFVLNEQIVQTAIDDGIPKRYLKILENPYLHYIRHHWNPALSAEAFRKLYRIPASVETVIVYAPDPVSLRKDALRFAFDEFTVLRELLTLLQHSNKHFLIIKTHPLQELPMVRRILEAVECRNSCLDDKNRVTNLELMQQADVVIGFYSNFLLEAHTLGKTIYRYFPDKNDPFEAAFRNSTTLFRTLPALAGALNL